MQSVGGCEGKGEDWPPLSDAKANNIVVANASFVLLLLGVKPEAVVLLCWLIDG